MLANSLFLFLTCALIVAHLGFVLFFLLGGLLVLRWRRAAWFHLPALAWGIFIETAATLNPGVFCPLTPLEQHWRERAGLESYEGSFVHHYIEPILYPEDLRGCVWGIQGLSFPLFAGILLVVIVGLNGTVYTLHFRRWRRSRRPPPSRQELPAADTRENRESPVPTGAAARQSPRRV